MLKADISIFHYIIFLYKLFNTPSTINTKYGKNFYISSEEYIRVR